MSWSLRTVMDAATDDLSESYQVQQGIIRAHTFQNASVSWWTEGELREPSPLSTCIEIVIEAPTARHCVGQLEYGQEVSSYSQMPQPMSSRQRRWSWSNEP